MTLYATTRYIKVVPCMEANGSVVTQIITVQYKHVPLCYMVSALEQYNTILDNRHTPSSRDKTSMTLVTTNMLAAFPSSKDS